MRFMRGVWSGLGLLALLVPMMAFATGGATGVVAAARTTPTPTADEWTDTFTVDGAEPRELPADAEKMIVHKVVDGDTLQLTYPNDDWYYVTRIIGINAPESVKPNSPVECYGPEASTRLKQLLPVGSVVWVSRDVSDEDQYGRRLRHVWILDGDTGEAFLVSEILVRGGYADARHYRPDDEYDDELAGAEREAQADHLGMWGACSR
ncbi:MAG: thermonuclease family protein [Thermomicrobiales bacterium]